MARSKYGRTTADYGSAPQTVGGVANVNVFAGVTLYVFDGDDYTTVTQVTDLLDQSGAPATSITGSATELLWFQGPDGTDVDLYGCVDETPDGDSVFYRFPVSVDNIVARIESLEGAATADLNDLDDVNTAGVADGDVLGYVSATQTWVATSSSGTGLPSGGTTDQTLIKQSATAGDADWETKYFVPASGSTDEALFKNSNTSGDTEWAPAWKRWSGTQAAYNALGTYDANTLYVVTG